MPPYQVIYRGIFRDAGGYAAESQGLVRELVRRGYRVRVEDAGRSDPGILDPAEAARRRAARARRLVEAERSLVAAAGLLAAAIQAVTGTEGGPGLCPCGL